VPAGRSPRLVRSLPIAQPHAVEATLAGRQPARQVVHLAADSVMTAALEMAVGRASVVSIVSDPRGARVAIDGGSSREAPFNLSDVSVGTHGIRATLAGYDTLDTTMAVGTANAPIVLALHPEPAGVLQIICNGPADFYLDDHWLNQGGRLENSGPQTVKPGTYTVRVETSSGEATKTLVVHSREKLVYDFGTGHESRTLLPPSP